MTGTERKREQRRQEAIAEVLATPHTRGRLHNERSGEGPRKYGMSEMERIIAAQERDENGKRVKPTGAGPTQMEGDHIEAFNPRAGTNDRLAQGMGGDQPFDVATSKADLRQQYADTGAYRRFEEKMEKIGEWFAPVPEDVPEGFVRTCRMSGCGALLNLESEREHHVWFHYHLGNKQRDYLKLLKEAEDVVPQELIDEATGKLLGNNHFSVIERFLKSRKPIPE
jgi:hypothetical protein